MKIVIAPDSFKETLTAAEAASAIAKGMARALPKARFVEVPVADGGEGTVQALVDATAGKKLSRKVKGPMGRPVMATFGLLGGGRTAVIEVAEACGLHLVPRGKRNPMKATSYGVGELIIAALELGAKEIIVGLGGSATNDCGAGMAQALGFAMLNERGRPLRAGIGGGALTDVARIDRSAVHPSLAKARVVVACDVNNPLTGRRGASAVFGPQKGASPDMVQELDAALAHFAKGMRADLNIAVSRTPGAGAAGGLGAGLLAFAGAELRSGVEIVLEKVKLDRHLKNASLVVSGEGQIDRQTPFGKAPAGVAALARSHGIPVVAIGGALAPDARQVFEHGIAAIESTVYRPAELEEVLEKAKINLVDAAERVGRFIAVGQQLK